MRPRCAATANAVNDNLRDNGRESLKLHFSFGRAALILPRYRATGVLSIPFTIDEVEYRDCKGASPR